MFKIFKQLSWYFKLRWKSYLLGVISLIICAILQAIVPYVTGTFIDRIVQGQLTSQAFTGILSFILGSAIVMYVLRYVWRTQLFGNSARLEWMMRGDLYKHFTKMDAQFYQKYRTGDLMAHATNDLAAIRFVASSGILTLTDSLSVGGATLIAMFFLIDWRLTLVSILPYPLLIIASRYFGSRIHAAFSKAQAAFSSMNDKVQESVSGTKVIKSLGQENEDYEDFTTYTDKIVKSNRTVIFNQSAYPAVIQGIMALCTMISLFFGGYLISINQLTIGQLVAFMSYITMMTWPLLAVGSLINILERGSASYDRVEKLMGEETTILEAENPNEAELSGDLEVDIESFTYPTSKVTNLTDIHFKIKEGQTLGVVGRTGSGKSTIFELITRSYDDYKGKITYDGVDIRDYSLNTYLSSVGYVSQNNYLFSTTISENIAFGRPDMSQEEIEYYAKLAQVHDDILDMPNGYDTQVGERGVSLSGGQKQRISIARALALNPELLILDDSLSAVDAKTEEKILEHLHELRKDKTTIIAAHRVSSVQDAEEIIVLDKGHITERGRHAELLAKEGWYADLFYKQQLQVNEDELELEWGNE